MLRVGKNVEITNYERIVLSETAMRGKSEYEVVNKGDKAEIPESQESERYV